MKFNLQLFGGGKGGSTTSYEPSEEQRELWRLQIESAKLRQPNEIALNDNGKKFMDEVIDLFNKYGSYDNADKEHNFAQMGETAIDRLNEQMVGLSTITTQFKKKSVTLSNGTTKEIYDLDANGNLQPIFGRDYNAANDLQIALRGTGTIGTDSVTGAVIRDNGLTGDLGGYVATAHADLDKGTTWLYEFVAGNSDTGVVGLNEPVGDLVTVVGGAVSSVNGGIDDYDGKFDSAATTANTSTKTAQGKNDTLVSGLNTSISDYNTLQSGKADTSESLLGGLNTSNNSAVTAAEGRLNPLITDTRNAATTANGNLDTIQLKGNTALTTANNNLTSRSADIQGLADTIKSDYGDLITQNVHALLDVNTDYGTWQNERQVISNATNNTLESIYSDYDPSRQAASTIIGGYRSQLDSETPMTNSNLGTLANEISNAYALANNHLTAHILGDVADTATANNALISNRPNYNLASQVLENDLNDINNDFDAQRKTARAC